MVGVPKHKKRNENSRTYKADFTIRVPKNNNEDSKTGKALLWLG